MSTPLVSRRVAGLKPPTRQPPAITSEGLTAHYGGPSPWGSTPDRSSPALFAATTSHERCASIWRAWQSFHMAPVSAGGRGWSDIAYNSGVCPHGYRFEGRGPGVRSGANGTNDGNSRSCATCYIAGAGDPLTDGAKRAFGDEFVRISRARWQHGDWKATACAGLAIRAWQRAGWPIPGAAPTPPPPPPPIDPEDPMTPFPTVIITDGTHKGELWMITSTGPVWIVDEAHRNNLVNARVVSSAAPAQIGSKQLGEWLNGHAAHEPR